MLIDFGFARAIGDRMHTRLAGPFCAPEVCEAVPRWSKAADVYALAATLKALIADRRKPGHLLQPLNRTLEVSASNRPSIDDLLSSLEELAHKRKLDQKRQDLWNEVLIRVAKDQHKGWFTRVLHKHRMKFEAIGMGFHINPVDRFRAIAIFVDQVAEAYPPRGLRLRTLADETEAGVAVRYLAALRIVEAHSADSLTSDQQDVWRRFQKLGRDGQRAAVARAVERVATAVQLESLVTLLSPYI